MDAHNSPAPDLARRTPKWLDTSNRSDLKLDTLNRSFLSNQIIGHNVR